MPTCTTFRPLCDVTKGVDSSFSALLISCRPLWPACVAAAAVITLAPLLPWQTDPWCVGRLWLTQCGECAIVKCPCPQSLARTLPAQSLRSAWCSKRVLHSVKQVQDHATRNTIFKILHNSHKYLQAVIRSWSQNLLCEAERESRCVIYPLVALLIKADQNKTFKNTEVNRTSQWLGKQRS